MTINVSKQVYSVPAFSPPAEYTAQKMKFSIKDFFSKCDKIRRFLRIWSHLLKKSFMENFIFLCSEFVIFLSLIAGNKVGQ